MATKNVITKITVEKELRALYKREHKGLILLLFVVAPVLILLDALVLWGIFSHIDNTAIQIVYGILLGGLGILFPLCISIVASHSLLSEKRHLKKGEFLVAVEPLRYKDEEPVYRHGLQNFLYFSDFERYRVSNFAYEFASSGDAYYLVHYPGKKEIKLCYPCKTYEYKES
ncbi:MAG: hypothetical protein IJV96_07920 [Clostridia bacterium]|nr:hypothetical protein [Clostridia bacterium]